MNCPLCKNNQLFIIYESQNIPTFQNKVYSTIQEAQNVQISNINLALCENCGFIFNNNFNPSYMNYDHNYQNEQAYSTYFKTYLNNIIQLFKKRDLHRKKTIEIGCGKGYFLEKMIEHGFNAMGLDPAYEGNNPAIIKDYFSEKYLSLDAEFIILRHTLEHIQDPLKFIHDIARANNYKGKIFIEVPNFDWILQKNAFWDIFYEHCNYFTIQSLSGIFNNNEIGMLFNNQYLYVLADLKDILPTANHAKIIGNYQLLQFKESLNKYQQFLVKMNPISVWGAGAKGATFVNLMDPKQNYISHLIDINPKKQNLYIAGTGHRIISPNMLSEFKIKNILVMNENYIDEIQKYVSKLNCDIFILGEL